MKDRIKLVRKHTGKNQTEFGEMLGVSKSAVQKWESGENDPTDTAVSLMHQKTGVNELWLKSGIGEPFSPMSRSEEVGKLMKSLLTDSPESFRSRLVTALLRFDPDGAEWEVLENIYNSIATEKPKNDERA